MIERRRITGRALVLGALVVILLVLLAAPLQRYFASRSDRSQAATQLQHDEQQLASLQKQQQLWSDPGYVQAQARRRLMYAMPGDTVYVVVTPGQKSDIEKTVVRPDSTPTGTWNQRLWGSIEAAGK